jgi:erythromycin esterase-like protein
MKKNILILTLVLIYSISLKAQTIEEKYSLDFRDLSWKHTSSFAYFYIDSTQIVNGKHPLQITSKEKVKLEMKKFYEKLRTNFKHPTTFIYQQDIVLPNFDKDPNVELILNSKCLFTQNIYLKVICFDAKEQILFTDSVDINKEQWGNDTLSFVMKNNTKMMTIAITSNNEFSTDEHIFWADRLQININKTDFNKYIEPPMETKPRKKDIYILSTDDESSYFGIKDFKDKKIIGIGESTHGSENVEIATFQCIKSLILNNKCKTVLFENYKDKCLQWDLYTQGIAPEEALDDIIENIKTGYVSGVVYRDFFRWLRKYNQNRQDKVRLFGVDNNLSFNYLYIIDYLIYLQNGGITIKSLPEIIDNQNKTAELIQADSETIKSFIGDKDFTYFMDIVNEIHERKQLDFERSLTAWFDNRDFRMWKATEKIISIYTGKKDIVVINAHSQHLNKKPSQERYKFYSKKSLGSYIYEKYNDKYFCISLQVGLGNFTQDREGMFSHILVTDSLEYPEINSFEKFCLNTEYDYFYCNAKILPKEISTIRLVPKELSTGRFVTSEKGLQFVFLDLKNRFDAFVFIRNSNPLQDIFPRSSEFNKQMQKKIEERQRKLILKL